MGWEDYNWFPEIVVNWSGVGQGSYLPEDHGGSDTCDICETHTTTRTYYKISGDGSNEIEVCIYCGTTEYDNLNEIKLNKKLIDQQENKNINIKYKK